MNASLQGMKDFYRGRIPGGIIETNDGTSLTSVQAQRLINWGIENGYKDLKSMPEYSDIFNADGSVKINLP